MLCLILEVLLAVGTNICYQYILSAIKWNPNDIIAPIRTNIYLGSNGYYKSCICNSLLMNLFSSMSMRRICSTHRIKLTQKKENEQIENSAQLYLITCTERKLMSSKLTAIWVHRQFLRTAKTIQKGQRGHYDDGPGGLYVFVRTSVEVYHEKSKHGPIRKSVSNLIFYETNFK